MLVQIIIAIYKTDILTSCNIQTSITGSTQPPIVLMNNLNTIIQHGIFITNFSTLVGRAIIDQNNFQMPIGLADDTVKTFFQIFLHIIDGDNDRNQRC